MPTKKTAGKTPAKKKQEKASPDIERQVKELMSRNAKPRKGAKKTGLKTEEDVRKALTELIID